MLVVEQHATGRKVAFAEPPAPHSSPIEHVNIAALGDWDVLRLLPVKRPHRHRTSDPAIGGKTQNVTAHRPMADVHVVHGKDRGIRRVGHHRDRLGGIYEVCARGILHNRCVVNDGMLWQVLEPLQKSGHLQIREICEVEARFVFAKAFSGNGLKIPVIRSYTTSYNYVLGSGSQAQGSL